MTWRALVVAGIAVLAGCGGFAASSGQPTETVTPAPVPPLPESDGTERAQVAPGLASHGITDLSALAAAHAQVLDGQPYVWKRTETRVRRGENGSVTRTERELIAVENETVYRRLVDFPDERRATNESLVLAYYDIYADGQYEYRSWEPTYDDEPNYLRNDAPGSADDFANYVAKTVILYLDVNETRVVRAERGDETYYRVIGTSETGPGPPTVHNYTARALVRPDGFVRNLNVRYDTFRDGSPVTVRYTFAYSEVGTATVEAPAWIPEAREAVTE